MVCLYPRPNGLSCGQCMNCRINDQMAWKFRLKYHLMDQDLAFWLTLQYDEEHLPYTARGEPCVCKLHCQNYFRQIRKWLKNSEMPYKLSYFLTSEYGPQTFRPHYHCLFMFKCLDNTYTNKQFINDRQVLYDHIFEAWYHGFVKEKKLHNGVIAYLTKYCLKESEFDPPVPTFRLISKGIGEYYLKLVPLKSILMSDYHTPDGILSRYYRSKLQRIPISDNESELMKQANSNFKDIAYLESLKNLSKFHTFEEWKVDQERQRAKAIRLYNKKLKKKYG